MCAREERAEFSHRQPCTGSVVVSATCATMPVSLSIIETKHPNADEWKKIYQALREIEKEGPGKQVVMRHVKAHVTGESRKQMKDSIKFNTEGNDKAENWQTWVLIWTKRIAQNDWRPSFKWNMKKTKKRQVCSPLPCARRWRDERPVFKKGRRLSGNTCQPQCKMTAALCGRNEGTQAIMKARTATVVVFARLQTG